MRIGIAKIIRRLPNEGRNIQINEYEINQAKEWCRECIALRVKHDSINADLNDIKYEVKECLDIRYWPPYAYKIIATLDFYEVQQVHLFPVEIIMGRETEPPKDSLPHTDPTQRAL